MKQEEINYTNCDWEPGKDICTLYQDLKYVHDSLLLANLLAIQICVDLWEASYSHTFLAMATQHR